MKGYAASMPCVARALRRCHIRAFTLVEMLLVIAIIGVMSALILTAVSNSAADSRMVVAREQQAVLQEALNSWISSVSTGTAGLQTAKTLYNNESTSYDRLVLIKDYLDDGTYDHFASYTNNHAQVKSDAMDKAGVYVQFTTWSATNYPRVNMVSQ